MAGPQPPQGRIAPHSGRPRRLLPRRLALAVGALGTAGAFLALLGVKLFRREGFGGFGINATGRFEGLPARPAPDFEIELFDGARTRLSDHRGTVVVLNFWASWCPPCRLEAPVLERAWQKYRESGFVLLGIDVWDEDQDARAFLAEFGVSYPNGKAASGTVTVEYGVTGLPETFFISRKGVLIRRWIGPLTEERIAAVVEPLLAEPAGPQPPRAKRRCAGAAGRNRLTATRTGAMLEGDRARYLAGAGRSTTE